MEISKIKEEYFSAEQLDWLEKNMKDPVFIVDEYDETIMRPIIRLDTTDYVTRVGYSFDNYFIVYSITPIDLMVSFFINSTWSDFHSEVDRNLFYGGYIVERKVAEHLKLRGMTGVVDLQLQCLFKDF